MWLDAPRRDLAQLLTTRCDSKDVTGYNCGSILDTAQPMIYRALFCFLTVMHCLCVSASEPKPLKIVTQRADDRVETSFAMGIAVISIHSPTGISHASIQRNIAHWPKKLTLRLHLRGLESLHIVCGQDALDMSISSHSRQQSADFRKDQQQSHPIDATSPYWTEIRMIGKDGKPASTIPLPEGYFEFELPQKLFATNPSTVCVRWIDFYR